MRQFKKFVQSWIHDFYIAVEAILANRFRAFLTALGIIFGVAAVISMMAIGNGAKLEIVQQLRDVGSNKIVIYSTQYANDAEEEKSGQNKKFSPGLSREDAHAIGQIVPGLTHTCIEISSKQLISAAGIQLQSNLSAVDPDYFAIRNIDLIEGNLFSPLNDKRGEPVVILESSLVKTLFGGENAIGKSVKIGKMWGVVIGVYKVSGSDVSDLKMSNLANSVLMPLNTFLMRIDKKGIEVINRQGASSDESFGDEEGKKQIKPTYDLKILVELTETEKLKATAALINRMLLRRHNNVDDFEIVIPLELIRQQQRSKNIFNFVLGAIAGISLLVGGIGIMNIMLASVLERIKEIGLRRAVGARALDIRIQFVAEASLICFFGGILGVLLGVGMSYAITRLAGILTVISSFSIIISFVISVAIGVIFGYVPAKRAADLQPVEALRND